MKKLLTLLLLVISLTSIAQLNIEGKNLTKEKFIAYSLGNFCTYAGINVSGINGWSPIIKVYTNNKGNFLKAQIISTIQTARSNIKIDSQKQVLKRIRELTKEDFPECSLTIDDLEWVNYSTN